MLIENDRYHVRYTLRVRRSGIMVSVMIPTNVKMMAGSEQTPSPLVMKGVDKSFYGGT